MNTVYRILDATWTKRPTVPTPPGGWEVPIDLDEISAMGVNMKSKSVARSIAAVISGYLSQHTGGRVRTFRYEVAPSLYVVSKASEDSEMEDVFREVPIAVDGVRQFLFSAIGGFDPRSIVLVTSDRSLALRTARRQLKGQSAPVKAVRKA